MIAPTTLLPHLTLVKYPLTIAGAVLVLGFSSQAALSLLVANAHTWTKPVTISGDFNVPPVRQLADLNPVAVEPAKPAKAPVVTDSSIVTLAAPAQSVEVATATEGGSFAVVPSASGNWRSGQIGRQAVNVRAGASNNAAKVGVLQAGAPVQIGRNDGGWVEVQFKGGAGWVYSSYLASSSIEITVDYSARSKG